MISQSAEYVLRVAVFLASQEGAACTTRQIAQATQVPEGYLAKLLQSLGRAGLVESQRGLHGGFVLARRPEEISLYDVVQAVAPLQRIQGCPLHLEAHRQKLCPLHQRLDDALAGVEKAFRQTTIAELLTEPTFPKRKDSPESEVLSPESRHSALSTQPPSVAKAARKSSRGRNPTRRR